MATLRKAAATLKGNPVDLLGNALAVGVAAPDFKLQSVALADVRLADFAGKVKIVVTVPSLDTGVCSVETKRFNDEAGKRPDWGVLCVSMDLPFAMKRWCGAENVANVHCLSAHRDASFGESYGVLIASGGLERCLARAVFVVGADDTVKYVEYVPEISTEPNYRAVLDAAERL
jgi:thiol peroxidase